MSKGFGKQPTNPKTNKLVNAVVRHCQQRSPERLDNIFDNTPANSNRHLLHEIVEQLKTDIDTLAWFCGYMCSEINCTEDNNKISHPITELSRLLIQSGMEPFSDFMPYPGCRIIILNTDKFESLPLEIQTKVNLFFEVQEKSGEEAQQINQAMLQELTLNS